MSGTGKLDQSLDEILNSRRKANRQRPRGGKSAKATTTTATAPVGGIKKSTKAKPTAKGVSTGPSATPRESKIMVTGLPPDVSEPQIKEYFTKSAGPVKKVLVTYNQNGTSRGIAQIIFSKPDTAAKAAKDLNGLLVDKRPMKIEVIVDASHAPEPPAVKSLGERVAPKAQPKSATTTKATTGTATRGRAARRGGRRGRNANRPKPKTAEELDAEMMDYFGENNNATTAEGNAPAANGTAQPAANGEDLGMDEISVSSPDFIIYTD